MQANPKSNPALTPPRNPLLVPSPTVATAHPAMGWKDKAQSLMRLIAQSQESGVTGLYTTIELDGWDNPVP